MDPDQQWPNKPDPHHLPLKPLNVGIVGGGIAGLYAALLLQREGHRVRIFEGTDRVGGRVRTHFFSHEDNQYFEAGAMRIPNSDFHAITFDLIKYIQSFARTRTPDRAVNLIPYILSAPGNDLFINGRRRPGVSVSSTTPANIDWPDIPAEFNKTAGDLMMDAIRKFLKDLNDDFEEGFKTLLKYDNYSFRFYLSSVMNYPHSVIDFMETVLSQTNQFALSVPELVLQNMDFDTKEWSTIDRGMSRLPNAMAFLVGYRNITYGARVTGIHPTSQDVKVTALGYNGKLSARFDRVIIAIPPAALKMIVDRPRWSVDKEMAIRSMHFEALYKMGLRFRTRFWERVMPDQNASKGGQSTTDLPIRWVVFPSNGIGSDGPGVLMVYAWMTDAATWLPLTPIERRSLALSCIAKLYDGHKDPKTQKPIKVHELLIGTADAAWSTATATGDAMFLPGQFKTRFEPARRPEGRVYFAGEHLSHHHTWISGAADSALYNVRLMLNDSELKPLHGFQRDSTADLPYLIGARDGIEAVADIRFKFGATFARLPIFSYGKQNHAEGDEGEGDEGEGDEGEGDEANAFPLDLGMDDRVCPLGPQMVCLDGPQGLGRV